MHLIYMKENPKYRWGYKECEEDISLGNEVGIIAEQGENESREQFFNRVGDRSAKDMYGSDEKKDLEVMSTNSNNRKAVAEEGYGLDKLIYDYHEQVRCAVADHGYGLDILINDKDWGVRATVAEQGYGLDVLIHDETFYVRATVAEQGYGLNILVKDPDPEVRVAVAKQGYGLNILVNDKSWQVCAEVARQGYGLDRLVNSSEWIVRKIIATQGYRLDYMLQKEKDKSIVGEIVKTMCRLGEFHWIPISKVKFLDKEILDSYFKLVSQNGLSSDEDFENFKLLSAEAIETFGVNSNFIEHIREVCKKYKIDVFVKGDL